MNKSLLYLSCCAFFHGIADLCKYSQACMVVCRKLILHNVKCFNLLSIMFYFSERISVLIILCNIFVSLWLSITICSKASWIIQPMYRAVKNCLHLIQTVYTKATSETCITYSLFFYPFAGR